MTTVLFIMAVLALYFVSSILKNPYKVVRALKPKKKSSSVKKATKYKFDNEELGRFKELENLKLNKSLVKDMIKEDFLKKTNKNIFVHSLENYMLWKFNEAPLIAINERLYKLLHEVENLNKCKKYSSSLGYFVD